jgi:hypothetical protein
MLASGALILSGLATGGAFAAAPKADSTIVGSGAWYTQAYENLNSGLYLTPAQADVTGPQRAPFGTSSHKITIGEYSVQTELYRTNAYDGVPVADLTRLEYSELARPDAPGAERQPAYLRLSVDTDDNGSADDSLFFFPANNKDQEGDTPANDKWQTWDVAHGKIDVGGDHGGETTLADYVSTHSGATLVNDPFDNVHSAGALALIVGGGSNDSQTNGEYFVDRVIVGENNQDTLYDFGGGSEVNGDTTDLTVDPAHLQGWKHQAYNNDIYLDSNQALVDGPAIPPAGGGSLQFRIDSDTDSNRVELFRTTQYDDTLVRDLRAMSYSTYQKADAGNATPQQPAYLRLSVDTNGDGGMDNSLFFYPANNADQQVVESGVWQTWDAADGLWNLGGDTGVDGAITLEDYVVAHPDATIVENADSTPLGEGQPTGGVAFMVGAAGANQLDASFYLDDITITKVDDATGKTVSGKQFDLEPTAPTLAIGDASVSEGNSGATLTFPVTLSRAFAVPTSVHYATSNGSAKAGTDYRATSGTVTVPAGSTTANVTVPVLSDKVREANETLQVTLTAPVGATLADGSAVGTIVNDDTQVNLGMRRAKHHRVRVAVSTLPVAAGAPVKVYRVTRSGVTRVLNTTLNASGRISVRLGHHYRPGKRVTMFATVLTSNGLYRSARAHVTIRR